MKYTIIFQAVYNYEVEVENDTNSDKEILAIAENNFNGEDLQILHDLDWKAIAIKKGWDE